MSTKSASKQDDRGVFDEVKGDSSRLSEAVSPKRQAKAIVTPSQSPSSSKNKSKSSSSLPTTDSITECSPSAQSKRYAKIVNEILTPTPSPALRDCESSSSTGRTVLAFGRECTKLEINSRVNQVYRLVRHSTGALGGNGYDGAIYGELTMASMQKVINVMVKKCGMNNQSRFIDVGSGLGKPNFHAAQDPAVRLSVGIELEQIRWHLAMYNLYTITDKMSRGDIQGKLLSCVNFFQGDVDDAGSTDPFTHIYMYDLGFPPPLQQSIAKKFNSSMYAQYLVSYRPPHRVIEEYGYEVEIVDQIPTSMHGSGESHTAYFYRRSAASLAARMTETQASTQANLKKLVMQRRPGFDEVDQTVFCDKAFYVCSKTAVGSVDALKDHCAGVITDMLNTKPKRERKQRVMVDM